MVGQVVIVDPKQDLPHDIAGTVTLMADVDCATVAGG